MTFIILGIHLYFTTKRSIKSLSAYILEKKFLSHLNAKEYRFFLMSAFFHVEIAKFVESYSLYVSTCAGFNVNNFFYIKLTIKCDEITLTKIYEPYHKILQIEYLESL
ncbi:hypothetical protein MXB_947, partial [Myxobolus squamalis]